MASEIKSDKLSPSTGTALQIGDASDTITIPTGATFTITDGLGVAAGGTGLASFTAGDVLYATGTTTLAKLAKGTGLQGLQTNSGATAPEWANSPQSLMTAAGDVLYASGANTLAKLAKGSDDEVLTLASGVPSWAAAAGGGKIGQVVSANKTDTSAIASATFADITGLTVDITPSATTSKVLVYVQTGGGSEAGYNCNYRMLRDAVVINAGDAAGDRSLGFAHFHATGTNSFGSICGVFLDSPSTTSATTYKVQANCEGGVKELFTNYAGASDSDSAAFGRTTSTITVMEVLA